MRAQYWEFVRTSAYETAVRGVLSDVAERMYVEDRLIADPRVGDLLVGTGGFRKLRVPLHGRGKRGGGRVVYYFVDGRGRIYLVEFFSKNVKENLTTAERNALKRMARELEAES